MYVLRPAAQRTSAAPMSASGESPEYSLMQPSTGIREWHRMMRRPARADSGYLILALLLICFAWGFLIGVLL